MAGALVSRLVTSTKRFTPARLAASTSARVPSPSTALALSFEKLNDGVKPVAQIYATHDAKCERRVLAGTTVPS
jgi:hypothetical protein